MSSIPASRRIRPPPRGIAIASTTTSVKKRLREYLAAAQPVAITEALWQELLANLAPVSESYLRDLLRETELPFEQPYAGIRQQTLEALEQSLREMLTVYTESLAAGNRDRARYCRRQVIAAKDRARFLTRSTSTPAEKQALKQEMVDWMLVWLENPEIFPAWVEARKRMKLLF